MIHSDREPEEQSSLAVKFCRIAVESRTEMDSRLTRLLRNPPSICLVGARQNVTGDAAQKAVHTCSRPRPLTSRRSGQPRLSCDGSGCASWKPASSWCHPPCARRSSSPAVAPPWPTVSGTHERAHTTTRSSGTAPPYYPDQLSRHNEV